MSAEWWANGPPDPRPARDPDEGGDAAYDAFVNAVDEGYACPECRQWPHRHRNTIMQRDTFSGPVFVCSCGARWFDWVTKPTQEAA